MKLPAINPSELSGPSGFLEAEGRFHFHVDDLKVGLNSRDEPLDGTTVELSVLGGEVAGQEGKTVNVTLWDIDQSKSADEQKQTISRLYNFYIATNVLEPSALGSSEVEFDEKLAIGSQIVMRVGHKQKQITENGKKKWVRDPDAKFLQIAYSDIFHVDDPEVATVPKDANAISMIKAEHRHDKAWFGWKSNKPAGASGSNGKAATAAKKSDYADDDDF